MLPSWQERNAKIVVYLSVKCPIDLHSLPGSTEGFCCVMMALFSITRRLLRTACTVNTVQSTTLHYSNYNQLVVVRPIYWRILLHHDGTVLDYQTISMYCKTQSGSDYGLLPKEMIFLAREDGQFPFTVEILLILFATTNARDLNGTSVSAQSNLIVHICSVDRCK